MDSYKRTVQAHVEAERQIRDADSSAEAWAFAKERRERQRAQAAEAKVLAQNAHVYEEVTLQFYRIKHVDFVDHPRDDWRKFHDFSSRLLDAERGSRRVWIWYEQDDGSVTTEQYEVVFLRYPEVRCRHMFSPEESARRWGRISVRMQWEQSQYEAAYRRWRALPWYKRAATPIPQPPSNPWA